MSLRLQLYELAARHAPDGAAIGRLEELAGFGAEPPAAARRIPRIVAVLGAALAGFALILWIAANWDDRGRFGRFALLEGAVLATGIAALASPRARVPLALAAMLAIGGLFAYFGQTYQTGADAWQLFALWAVLSLPLCLAVRSDVLWAPFALIAMAGISLWMHAQAGHQWRVRPEDLRIHGIGWMAAILLCAALSAALRRFTGAGAWALRTAVTLAIVMITFGAVVASFGSLGALQFWIGLAVMLIAVAVFALPEMYDLYALSAAALSVNTLAIIALGHVLLKSSRGGESIGVLLLLGLISAAMLAGTVAAILRLSRLRESEANP
jgi:uncharacterized membrane protein